MAYTDAEIKDYAFKLEAAGAPPEEIERFVAAAVAERGATPAAPSPDSVQTPSRKITTPIPTEFAGFMAGPHTPMMANPYGQNIGEAVDPLVSAGLEGGGAAAGQTLGAMTGPAAPIAIPALGALGGMAGNAIDQLRHDAPFSPGQMLAAGATGAVPGASLAKAPAKAIAKEALKQTAGNVAATTLQTEVDEGRLPTATEATLAALGAAGGTLTAKQLDKGLQFAAKRQAKALQNAVRDETLAAARAAGYVIPPSKVNPSPVNNLLESIAGKAATAQEAVMRNQEVTDALAKKALGLPPSAPITESVLRQVRTEAAAPYEEISKMAAQGRLDLETLKKKTWQISNTHELEVLKNDPDFVRQVSEAAVQAGADVEALKRARHEAHAMYRFYQRSADPDHLAKARSAEELASTLEQKIEAAAQQMGRKDLVDQLRTSRKRIAQAYQIEQALNLGDSNISAPVLGRSYDKGTPLTGPLKTTADFQNAFPAFAREAARTPAPGVNKLKIVTALGLGGAGYGTMGPQGLLLGAAPLLEGPARSLVLSPAYQKVMGQPFNGVNQTDFIAAAAQFSGSRAGRSGVTEDPDQRER